MPIDSTHNARCTTILVARLNDNRIPADDIQAIDYNEWALLETVSKVNVSREIIYDEGEVRAIKREFTVTVEAVIHEDMDLGNFLDYSYNNGSSLSFPKKLELLANFLSQQGLAINFNYFPNSIKRVVPHKGGTEGWLLDTFNGPKTLSIKTEPIVADKAVMLTWTVKITTAQSSYEAYDYDLPRKISSDFRMDIDPEGQLIFIASGTIYANTIESIMKAREDLKIGYQPLNVSDIQTRTNADPTDDEWGMVNGFKKTVSFNIAKDGRSAKFQIKYSQYDSNNAHPLYLRDIEFDQEIESSFFNQNAFEGAAFQTWKVDFSGKIRIPPRFSAWYAWYVLHFLVTQQLRRTELVYNSEAFEDAIEENEDQSNGDAGNAKKDKIRSRAIPMRLKLKHQHYKRVFKFNVDYFVVSPLTKVLHNTCLLERVNNDFYRKEDLEDPENYKPHILSRQWVASNRSNNLGDFSDSPYGPNSDVSGAEIVENTQWFDPLKNADAQPFLQNKIVTTIFDPLEEDPAYTRALSGYPTEAFVPESGAGEYGEVTEDILRKGPGRYDNPPLVKIDTSRKPVQIHPEASWIKFVQEYEILETNPTLPTESLADISSEDFVNKGMDSVLGAGPSTVPSSDQIKSIANDTGGVAFHGRKSVPLEDSENYTRKTYASRPGRFYLKVKGYGVRANYRVPVPMVQYIAGHRAIRVGDAKTLVKNLAPDSDIPLHLTAWEQVYTVDANILSNDIMETIKTSGTAIIYA